MQDVLLTTRTEDFLFFDFAVRKRNIYSRPGFSVIIFAKNASNQTYFDGAFQPVAFDCLTVVEAVQVVRVEVEMRAMIQVVWWR